MRKTQRKFMVGFGLVIAAIGYLIYTGFSETTMYYMTVSELHASPRYDKNMRMNGHVVTGSIKEDQSDRMKVYFMAEEGGKETPVVYTGLVPDTFKDGSEVVVEGSYMEDGTFVAHTLFAKCPSKYESEGYDDLKPANALNPSES